MIVKNITLKFMTICACSAVLFVSCEKDTASTASASSDMGSISIKMTDAPGNYQQVNVDIKTVSVHLVPNSGNAQWIDLPTKSGVYDLLKLQNGIDTTVVDSFKLATGKITQMRLLLGSHNTVMVDSVVHDLKIPSGTESGIKVIGRYFVTKNQNLKVLLDFDAERSILGKGNGEYQMKPTIQTK